MTRLLTLIFAALSLSLAGACSAGRGSEPQPISGTHPLTETDSGSTVTLRVGDSLDVALEANATAGYRWLVRAQDEGSLATVETRFTPHSELPGSAGTDFRRVRAKTAGQTRLVLVLCRPWDCDVTTAGTFEINVRIVPANDCGCAPHG